MHFTLNSAVDRALSAGTLSECPHAGTQTYICCQSLPDIVFPLFLCFLHYDTLVELVIVSAWSANTKALEQNTIKLLTTGDATTLCSRVTTSRRRRTAWNCNTCQLKTCSPCNTDQERKLILMGHPFWMISCHKIAILCSAIFAQFWRFPRSHNFCWEMLLCTTRATLFSFKEACMQTVITL